MVTAVIIGLGALIVGMVYIGIRNELAFRTIMKMIDYTYDKDNWGAAQIILHDPRYSYNALILKHFWLDRAFKRFKKEVDEIAG